MEQNVRVWTLLAFVNEEVRKDCCTSERKRYRMGGTLGLRLLDFLDNRPYAPVTFVPQERFLVLISVRS